MSSTLTNVVKTDALPPNVMKPLPPGASDIYKAGMVTQRNEAALQQSLIGGIRRRKKMKKSRRIRKLVKKGGANPVVLAPAAPSYDTNPQATNANNMALTGLAVSTQNNMAFDTAKNQSQVAAISAEQQAVYQGKGGKKWGSNKKGGSFISWGCLSGGKKTRKHKKTCKCKTCKCKTCRYKRRKHRKTKRHHH
jgi:hypothetical protein